MPASKSLGDNRKPGADRAFASLILRPRLHCRWNCSASALFRHNQGWAAFVITNGRANIRPLMIGQRAGLTVQVLSGLKTGEQVITHPEDKIKQGGRVKVRA